MSMFHAAHLGTSPPSPIQWDWSCIRSRSELEALVSRQGLSRLQALRAAEPGFAVPIEADDVERLLQAAAQSNVPLQMQWLEQPNAFESRGCIELVQSTAQGLRIHQAGRLLHLCSDHLSRAWIVRHPTALGLSCALELFDEQEDPLLVLSGECCALPSHTCPDQEEETRCTRTWRRMVSELLCDSACSSAC
jgi:putative heme degradation protein